MKKVELVNTTPAMAKWRWFYDNENKVLHRVKNITNYVDFEQFGEGDYWYALFDGVSVCGKVVQEEAPCPGIFQRIYTPRCEECCKQLDIEQGNGIPLNQKISEPDIVWVKE